VGPISGPVAAVRLSELAAAADVVVSHVAFRPRQPIWIRPLLAETRADGLLEVVPAAGSGFRLGPSWAAALLWFARAIRWRGDHGVCSCSGPALQHLEGRRWNSAAAEVRLAAPIRRSGGPAELARAGLLVGQTVSFRTSVEASQPPPHRFRCKAPTCCLEIPAEQGAWSRARSSGPPAVCGCPCLELCLKGVCLRSSGRCCRSLPLPGNGGPSLLERLSSSCNRPLGRPRRSAPTATTQRLPRQRPPHPVLPPGLWMSPPWVPRTGSGEVFNLGLGHAVG